MFGAPMISNTFCLRYFKIELILVLCLFCRNVHAIRVELDVAFIDTISYRYLYVVTSDEPKDTLACFDSLSFTGLQRISLFFPVPEERECQLILLKNDKQRLISEPFEVSRFRTTFKVFLSWYDVEVVRRDFLYPLKNEDEHSYFYFLLFFVLTKLLISTTYILIKRQPKYLISIAAGTFLLSASIDWFFPIHYGVRYLLTILIETLLIALVGKKAINWLQSLILVLIVNIIGFGLILIAYLFYVFW